MVYFIINTAASLLRELLHRSRSFGRAAERSVVTVKLPEERTAAAAVLPQRVTTVLTPLSEG